MATKNQFVYAVGRRKQAAARVRLYRGKGENSVNGKAADEFFPSVKLQAVFSKPFKVTNTEGRYYFTAKISGGGIMSQTDALALGIARTMAAENREEFKPQLRKHNLLTRDPRVRQRRMVGTGGKARRKKQSPKR